MWTKTLPITLIKVNNNSWLKNFIYWRKQNTKKSRIHGKCTCRGQVIITNKQIKHADRQLILFLARIECFVCFLSSLISQEASCSIDLSILNSQPGHTCQASPAAAEQLHPFFIIQHLTGTIITDLDWLFKCPGTGTSFWTMKSLFI